MIRGLAPPNQPEGARYRLRPFDFASGQALARVARPSAHFAQAGAFGPAPHTKPVSP